jgi:hypothetical protein
VSFVHRVFVTLDCAEPRGLAEFWAAMLEGEVVFTTAQAVGVRAEHVWLSAMRVDGYRSPTWPDDTVPKQVHLDLGGRSALESAALPAFGSARAT